VIIAMNDQQRKDEKTNIEENSSDTQTEVGKDADCTDVSKTGAAPRFCVPRRRLHSLQAELTRRSHYLQMLQSQSPACREADRQTD